MSFTVTSTFHWPIIPVCF